MIEADKYKNLADNISIDDEPQKPVFNKDSILSSNDNGGLRNTNSVPQMLSYYPKYMHLDSLTQGNKKDVINIFVDVKGCCSLMYTEWCVKHILETSKEGKHLNLDLFSSILYFIAFHKRYGVKRGVKFNFIFFMEQGKSKYHLNVYNQYKLNRRNSDLFGLDAESRDKFYQILDKNYSLCEYVINRIPDCSFYCLKYCEADFIPYYLLKTKFTQEQRENSLNVIYSRDKDMLQCLEFENTYQFYRASYNDKTDYITQDTIYSHYIKDDSCKAIRDGAKWFPLFLSLCGDLADGIPGIKGLGPKLVWKNMDLLMKAFGYNANTMYERVMNGDNLLTESWEYNSTPTTQKIFGNPDVVKRNMKLISYRALTEYVDGGFPLEAIEVQKYINKIWTFDKKLTSYNVLWNTLKSKGLNDIVQIETIQECFL